MSHRTRTQNRTWRERALSLLLAAVLLVGLVPSMTLPAAAEHWADAYLDQLVDWGVMRADQTSNPDAALTRAEFMAIINRAYGYTEKGPIPFEDVNTTDWFYDDVAIAYTAGYMAGTSGTTASPNEPLTREQAVCILGRNMMMKETPGENLSFADSRNVSDWARGTVKTAVDNYIISGYPDNTFHPLDSVSKGQMAVLITQCVGNPIQRSGSYELGGVFGNVTITSPNVTLRNTTISGDLFVSGGVGLGGIKLENVNVLGRIIVSSTGESESGDASMVMRNVTAEEMLVDNMRNKTATIRADGITDIAKTVVRTNAYLEDNNTDDKGLMNIELDGESGTRLTLAGRIKEVVDKTPNSYVQVAKGTVAKLTVDEAAVNATVQLDRNTEVKEMNLDVATNVTGDGDIGQLNANAPGSVVSMLPDKIYIRPGITSNIAGVIMDHVAAEEGSLDPRLLSGYPAAKDIAPTGLRADFAGNKKGTVFWAVSSITDGSIDADDLIAPPSYGSKAIRNGSVAAPSGGGEVSAQITGLTVGGSYYLSAVLVDDQGNRSPVKTVSFSTPDNTIPAFGQGYPRMSFVGKANEHDAAITAQVAVLATKTCKMYYAVLPQGATAPTTNELKSASVSGNLGYGVVDLEKNQVWDADDAIIVSRRLEELKDYVLYLWLTDVDGTNSSAVTSLAFRTPDATAPVFVVHPHVNGQAQATSVPMAATLNENGTIYWVVVESGTAYPKPNNQSTDGKDNAEDGKTALLTSDYAKLQVANGMNALRSGRVNATANTEVVMNITGLEAEKSYDLYYLAQDTAGNYSIQVYKLEGGIRTLDTNPPTIRQFFTKYDGQDNTKNPMQDTSIILEFSENVCFTNAGGRDIMSLFAETQTGTVTEQETARAKFVQALRSSIVFNVWVYGMDTPADVKGDQGVGSNWVIDYEEATVANVNGRIQLTFPSAGLNLKGGGIYSFAISGLEDMSGHEITPATVDYKPESVAAGHNVPIFTVVFARVRLTGDFLLPENQIPQGIKDLNVAGSSTGSYGVDFKFRMMPEDTEGVADGMAYDLLLWTDTNMEYDLYYRAVTVDKDQTVTVLTHQQEDGKFIYGMPNMSATEDKSGWVMLGSSSPYYPTARELAGKSLHTTFNGCTQTIPFPNLNTLRSKTPDGKDVYYDFVLSIRRIGDLTDPNTWSGSINLYVDVAAGNSSDLFDLARSLNTSRWQQFLTNGLNNGGGESIGSAQNTEDPRRLHLWISREDSVQPKFADNYPSFETGETSVSMNLTLTRPGTVYYAIGYADELGNEPTDTSLWNPSIRTITEANQRIRPEQVPNSGRDRDTMDMPVLLNPLKGQIQNPTWAEGSQIVPPGSLEYRGVASATVNIDKLSSNRTYYVYFVIRGSGMEPSEVEIYKFKTTPVAKPKITINSTPNGVNVGTHINSYMDYLVYTWEDASKITWLTTETIDGATGGVNNYAHSVPTPYQGYSLLKALTTSYQYKVADPGGNMAGGAYFPVDGSGNREAFDGYTVFDIYASDALKEQLGNWVREGSYPPSGQSVRYVDISEQEMTLTGGRIIPAPLRNIIAGTDYLILTVAQNQNPPAGAANSAIDSFRAFRPVGISDPDEPKLESVNPSLKATRDKTTEEITYTGTIALNFSKTLYIMSSAEGAKNPTLLTKGDDGKNASEVVYTAGGADVDAVLNSTSRKGTIVISFDGTRPTAQIQGGSLVSSGGAAAMSTLEIRTYEVRTDNDTGSMTTIDCYLEVKWGGSNFSGSPFKIETFKVINPIAPTP